VPANGANGGGVSGDTSEDCLYLNLWAPANASNAPVMLWLYGGAGYLGGAHLPTYDGTSFARQGVVVVTINYRLGLLGNFAHPALTRAAGPAEPLANYALMDAIAGLEWVQRNIGAFGGDPLNVTLFGQSAGGAMVSRLLSSPPAAGLFHKAVIHSGTRLDDDMTLAQGEAAGSEAATALGLPGASATVTQLRAVPVEDILANSDVRQGIRGITDGKIKTVSTRDGFATGATFDVPVVAGSNNGEGGADRADELVDLAASGAPSFQYWFTYVPAAQRAQGAGGAPHSAELRYAFNTLRGDVAETDRRVAAGMHSCWAAFAKAPVSARQILCASRFVWEARTPDNDAIAILGERFEMARATPIVAQAPN
jgi:para-nitrobenzyl esterase